MRERPAKSSEPRRGDSRPDAAFRALSAGIREVLGLTQQQFGQLLGIGEKTLARLESRKETPDLEWTPAMSRLLWMVGELTGDRLREGLLGLVRLPGEGSGATDLVSRIDEATRQLALAPERSLADAVRDRARPREWVYWATSARANDQETRHLADEGLICRPLFFSRGTSGARAAGHTDYPYLESLRAGDAVLLCHDTVPSGWYRLEEREAPPRTLDLPPGIPRVFTFVPRRSPTGDRLAAGGYALWDGRQPGNSASGWFSCLAVKPLSRPLVTPAPRRPGIRDTMTAFAPAGTPRQGPE